MVKITRVLVFIFMNKVKLFRIVTRYCFVMFVCNIIIYEIINSDKKYTILISLLSVTYQDTYYSIGHLIHINNYKVHPSNDLRIECTFVLHRYFPAPNRNIWVLLSSHLPLPLAFNIRNTSLTVFLFTSSLGTEVKKLTVIYSGNY